MGKDYRLNAIINLLGNSGWSITDGEIFYQDDKLPTVSEEDIKKEVNRLRGVDKKKDIVKEARDYLTSTDFKFNTDYDKVVSSEIKKKRAKARRIIRRYEDKDKKVER